jgi:2-polyprenyl-6-methoxyphenol hydroxylase-like FAD-dependent oxidoreductase
MTQRTACLDRRARYFDGAEPRGPLPSFDLTETWVNHPYRDGVALIGDAAGASDPVWGQGLSLTAPMSEF